ncbi:hypothetical protein FA15DRAFT_711064 [Coprinopsis marcescibilis]|uniref:Uncharacterized protein n=1 Tax=Coprinopsis marcescibilis TaxID=230819 RepID=A0A5C3KBP7_COPMA|nr:hypothetical protein FA15DRAFT_711064 [Coprinopsis marcescibilis]
MDANTGPLFSAPIVKRNLPQIAQELSFKLAGSGPLAPITLDREFDIGGQEIFENRRQVLLARRVNENQLKASPSTRGSENPIVVEMAESSEEEDEDEDVMEVEAGPLIKKPPGEPGRPNSGRFNIEQAMGWTKEDYSKLQAFVATECEVELDTEQSIANQEEKKIKLVCISAAKTFPGLKQFKDAWPVRSLIKLQLKKTSEQARKTKKGADLDDIMAAISKAGKSKKAVGKRKEPEGSQEISEDEEERRRVRFTRQKMSG